MQDPIPTTQEAAILQQIDDYLASGEADSDFCRALAAHLLAPATRNVLAQLRAELPIRPAPDVAHNPVHYLEHYDDHEPHGWYFWNETWTERLGPFDTEAQANEELTRYAANL